MQDNYTLEVMVLGNAYQPSQIVYSVSQPSEGVISSNPLYSMWGVCITLSPDNTVSLQFPCLSAYDSTLSFFSHNVSIPLVEQNTPTPSLSVVAGANVSDVNLLTFTQVWSLSALCGWFSASGILQPLHWELGNVQISMFSFRYDLNDNPNTCETPDGLRFVSNTCNSTALAVVITSHQITVTYWMVNQVLPLQQLIFPSSFRSGLINITISGNSINIFTTPPNEVGEGSTVHSGMLENMHECVGYANRVVLMGPSCSSLEVYGTQGFYVPPSRSCYEGVSARWTYATLGFACATASLMGVVVMLLCYWKLRRNPKTRALLANVLNKTGFS